MRNLVAGLMVIAMIGLAVGLGTVMWNDVLDQRETAQLQAEAAVAEAEADRLNAKAEADEAAANLERAQGERSLKEDTGTAIRVPAEAAARAVDANTDIVTAMGRTNTLYDRLLPLGGLLFLGTLLLAGAALGVGGLAAVLWYKERKKVAALKLVAPVADTALDLT